MEVKATPQKACAVLPKIKRRFIYMKIETKCLHEGYHPKNTEPRVVPIVQSTTYVYDSTDDVAAVFDDPTKSLIYSRFENPTVMAVEEKIAVAKSRYSGKTKICCTRYGNVMCSRGSVIPLWIDQICNGNPITLTEPKMTRFIMSLEEAVDLVLFAFEHGQNGDILVQKAPACTIQTQAEAVCELFGGKKEDIKVIGIRHGEKMYETLLTKEECAKAEDMGNFYRVPADNRGLNYDKFFKEGDTKRAEIEEFNSDNTYRLNLEETKAKIGALEYIKKELSGEGNFVQ